MLQTVVQRQARPDARGEQRRVAQSLFIGEGDQLDREREPLSFVVEVLDRRDAGQDAERAVVAPRVADGVEMPADDERARFGAPLLRRIGADQVPERVEFGFQAGLAHPFGGQLHRGFQRRRAVAAGDAAIHLGECGQLIGAGHQLVGKVVEGHESGAPGVTANESRDEHRRNGAEGQGVAGEDARRRKKVVGRLPAKPAGFGSPPTRLQP